VKKSGKFDLGRVDVTVFNPITSQHFETTRSNVTKLLAGFFVSFYLFVLIISIAIIF